MGGDAPPSLFFEALSLALSELSEEVRLVGYLSNEAAAAFKNLPLPDRISFHLSSQSIGMEESPLYAVRTKKDSSLVNGIRALQAGRLDAFVSTANTGALVASASLFLPKIGPIERPALLALFPSRVGRLVVIDVGGQTSFKAAQLVQFAQIGVTYQKSLYGIVRPRVGLLNIGVEAKKGTQEHRHAYDLLSVPQDEFTFVGNIEGKDVYSGAVDVLVTDGFTGNVFLKTSEGVSRFILEVLQEDLGNQEAFQRVAARLSDENHSGAVLAGVNAVVVKCHGGASVRALANGILEAAELVKRRWLEAMRRCFEKKVI